MKYKKGQGRKEKDDSIMLKYTGNFELEMMIGRRLIIIQRPKNKNKNYHRNKKKP